MFLKTKIGFSCHLGKGLPDIKKPRRRKFFGAVRMIIRKYSKLVYTIHAGIIQFNSEHLLN